MGGLAAGCRTGIEHAHAFARVEQWRRKLSGCVLHREPAARISRQRSRRPRPVDDHCGRAGASGGVSLRRQCRDIIVGRDAADIDTQAKRRPRIAGVKHDRVILRSLGTDAVDPPPRVRKSRLGLACDGGEQVIPAPQKVAQHRVDQTLRGSALDPGGRAYCAVDDRVLRRLRMNELVEGNPEERLDARVGERPLGEEPHDSA